SLLLQMRRAPLTMALVIINIALYPATRGIDAGHFSDLLHLMTLVPFQQAAGYLYFSHLADVLASMQYWRLLTPMFLHFSIMHIAFNLTFLWVFGSRIEVVSKSVVLLAVVLITSIASNLAQYALTGPTLFGGMSGVVAGLLGYCMVWSRLVPERSMGLAPPIYIGMIALLALGAFGLFNFMTPGKIANGAHFGGLASGAALGLLFGLFARQKA
ncbi:MAG TPA: rhomboid family intramembrane serine protease, partial [Pseudomonadales bacterium]|nr:rhomboid family intramembrane serine protease [Pseudomonadales bacterium]